MELDPLELVDLTEETGEREMNPFFADLMFEWTFDCGLSESGVS